MTKHNERTVAYFRVDPKAYREAIAALSQLPYAKVARTMQLLTEGARAIFLEPQVSDQNLEPDDNPYGAIVECPADEPRDERDAPAVPTGEIITGPLDLIQMAVKID